MHETYKSRLTFFELFFYTSFQRYINHEVTPEKHESCKCKYDFVDLVFIYVYEISDFSFLCSAMDGQTTRSSGMKFRG